VTGVYQILSTGTELIMIPQGTPGKLYTYQLNANVQSQWYVFDYSSYGYQITEGVIIGSSVYFVIDGFNMLEYSDSLFNFYNNSGYFVAVGGYSLNKGLSWNPTQLYLPFYLTGIAYGNGVFVAVGSGTVNFAYSVDNGLTWTGLASVFYGSTWYSVAFGNGVFVAVGNPYQAYSTDNGLTWNYSSTLSGNRTGVVYGNGVFVVVGTDTQAYSVDNGLIWTSVVSPITGSWRSVAFGNGVFVMVGTDTQAYSTDNGLTWTSVVSPITGSWSSIAFGNGIFVMVGTDILAYSTDNGLTWTSVVSPLTGYWSSIAFGNGVFVASSTDTPKIYSNDNGLTWNYSYNQNNLIWQIAARPSDVTFPGTGFKNLLAVGSKIYASSNSASVSSVFEIDTSADLNSPAAYKYYSSTDSTAPITFDGTAPKIFANGPRYIYMFSQGDNTATNIVEFDPYGPDQTFKASILVDYESLPEGTKKPDKALLGLIQTQKVTDMTQMNIKGPVKELWVTGVSATTNVFQYSNLATQSTLELAGEQIVTDDVGTHTFFNVIEPFEAHTSMPIRNVSVLPFEFDPESEIPNGTVNFSRIRDQIFDGGAETVWARTYNLLAIQGGIGNLMYN
jgi:hypothetical protein